MNVSLEDIAIGGIDCVWIDRADDCGSVLKAVRKSIRQSKSDRSLRFEVKEDGGSATIVIRWNDEAKCYVYKADWYDGHEDKESGLDVFANDKMIILRGAPAHELAYFEITLA